MTLGTVMHVSAVAGLNPDNKV